MAASSNMVIQRIPCYLTTAKNLCHHVRIFSDTCFVVSPLYNMYGRTSLEKMKCRNSIPCHMHGLMQTREIQFVGYWRVLNVHTEYFNNEERFIWRNSLWLPTCRDDDTFSQKESKWWTESNEDLTHSVRDKSPPFRRRHFRMHFLQWQHLYYD